MTSKLESAHAKINGGEGALVLTASHWNVEVADLKLDGEQGFDATVSEIAIPPLTRF